MPKKKKQNYDSYKNRLPFSDYSFCVQLGNHLERVRNIEAMVDTSAPLLVNRMYYKPETLLGDARTLQRISVENKRMLQKINIINRTTGRVVSFWENLPEVTSNYQARESEARRIAKDNYTILQRILTKGPNVTATRILMEEWNRKSESNSLMSRYRHIKHIKVDEVVCNVPRIVIVKKRQRCFLKLKVENESTLGKLIIELYNDYVPITTENFLSICNGTDGLTYKNCPFHRIITDLLCMGGDITKFNGTGGISIYGEVFPDENLLLRHADRGILSMINAGPDSNNSQFLISFKKISFLDRKHVVFGRIIGGMQTLAKLENLGTLSGRPRARVVISECGRYTGK